MKTIEEEWKNFRRTIIPLTASNVQVVEMKKAFYGGAGVAMVIIMESTKDYNQEVNRKAITNTFVEMMKELNDFAEDMINEGPRSN